MGRTAVLYGAFAVSICGFAGCGTTPKWNWFADTNSLPDTAAEAAKEPAEKSAEKPAESTADSQSTADSNSQEVATKEPSDSEPRAVDPKTLPDYELRKHDAETLKLIDQELSDASPAEREQWYQLLKQLSPEMIRQTLRSRRLTVSMRENAAEESPSTGVVLAGHDVPAPDHLSAPFQANASPQSPGTVMPQSWHHGRPQQTTAAPPGQFQNVAAAQPPVNNSYQYGGQMTAGAAPPPNPLQPVAGQYPAGNAPPNAFAALHQVSQPMGQAGQIYQAAHSGAAGFHQPPSGMTGGTLPQWPQSPAQNSPPQQNPAAGPSPPSQIANAGGMLPVPGNAAPLLPEGVSLDEMIAAAEADVHTTSPGETEAQRLEYLRKHVNLRWLYVIAGRRADAMEAIPGIEQADQEFWQQMFWSVFDYFDAENMPHKTDRASQAVAQLRSAVQRLQVDARLELQNVSFCRRITSFGNVEPFERDEFSPGQPVLIYAEVQNFKSDPTVGGEFRTRLRSTIEIYGPQGLVHRDEFPPTEDMCGNQRQDYFHSYKFDIPKRAGAGPHSLKLIVFDELSGKEAETVLRFVIK